MHRFAGRSLLAFASAFACLGLACAADQGDPLKTGNGAGPPSASGGGPSGSSSSSGGGTASSGLGSSSSGAGSSSASSSSGSASSGGPADAASGTSTGAACAPSSSNAGVSVSYLTQATSNPMSQGAISFQVELMNAGFGAVSLSDVTVRYWFTADGNALSGLVFACDYASNANMTTQDITKTVNAAFTAAPAANTTATSDSYIELSFASSAGNLPFDGSPATVQVRVHGGPSSQPYMDTFNETNDYSFDATKTMFQLTQTITAYVKGQLVWGCEP